VEIALKNIGKSYRKQHLYENLNAKFEGPGTYAILGENASGKSTLLRIICGLEKPSEGSLEWNHEGETIDSADYYKELSIASPYLDLFEELSLKEHIEAFKKFKALQGNPSPEEFADLIELKSSLNKPLKNFSSGMKQRLKVGLALYAEVALVLLDEPTTNLDKKGWLWYQSILASQAQKRLILVFSNYQEHEYQSCLGTIELNKFK